MKTRVAVLGATGYAGATAAGLVLAHPELELSRVTSRSHAGRTLGEVYPGAAGELPLEAETEPGDAEVVMVALPHGLAGGLAQRWVDEGRTVVDLGADFRLADPEEYRRWYGVEPAPGPLLAQAILGLPEVNREALRGATLIACPGCYSTAAILALRPAAVSGLAVPDYIVDAASGVSGAGRSPGLGTHFSELTEDFRAYAVAGHRHSAEMIQALTTGGVRPRLTFVPHLVPMVRGILATCYFDLVPGSGAEDLRRAYEAAYAAEPFVSVVASPPRTKEVAGTNRCLVHVAVQGDRMVVVAAIDNLVKGAAGQAIQALNVARGWPETTGLDAAPRWP